MVALLGLAIIIIQLLALAQIASLVSRGALGRFFCTPGGSANPRF